MYFYRKLSVSDDTMRDSSIDVKALVEENIRTFIETAAEDKGKTLRPNGLRIVWYDMYNEVDRRKWGWSEDDDIRWGIPSMRWFVKGLWGSID